MDENGENWTPIGQNDAVTWPDLSGLFRRKDVAQVEGHLAYLTAHGVTCLRIMLEYCQTEHRYFEKPVGRYQPHMIQFWDDLFVLCEKYKLRILLTPFDTFWMRRRWKHHPYNALNGGPCKSKTRWLTCPETLAAIKNRFSFVIERWGGSGVLFAWDLWNEIGPANALGEMDGLYVFVDQISDHIRQFELRLYGKTHPQTVSVFAPLMQQHDMSDLIFKHPKLDFASTHFYENKTINYPRNTADAAVATGEMVREALFHLPENRPFLDSEHGPIDYFKKRKNNLPEEFDDQYFLNMQWAHLASGGAGGGMRWPYRHPHVLTHGMRRAQLNLAGFLELIDWKTFKRQNLNEQIEVTNPHISVFGCGDDRQAVIWLLERQNYVRKKIVKKTNPEVEIAVPWLNAGLYRVSFWNTVSGKGEARELYHEADQLRISFHLPENNIALAIRKIAERAQVF
ncbi:hypothetical protein E0F88_25520 [Dyadobacter psychrotolerans]|uniref:Glycoside hydrolase family 5 domain-containing protein n=1 Tax=Dyadobacter psychrotolerans TaxID=2541721 RepID=A0A4R5DHQ4_9BACT|nr:hypothetical protein E0F88_25520 [Dyadobacter psychrotolerans]